MMKNQAYVHALAKDKGSAKAALLELAAHAEEHAAMAMMMSAAGPLPTTVTWNLLHDIIAQQRAAQQQEAKTDE